jgi:hypothetical protein
MIWRALVAFDAWVNWKTGGNPGETISSRIGRNIRRAQAIADHKWGRWLPAWFRKHALNSIQPEHERR